MSDSVPVGRKGSTLTVLFVAVITLLLVLDGFCLDVPTRCATRLRARGEVVVFRVPAAILVYYSGVRVSRLCTCGGARKGCP